MLITTQKCCENRRVKLIDDNNNNNNKQTKVSSDRLHIDYTSNTCIITPNANCSLRNLNSFTGRTDLEVNYNYGYKSCQVESFERTGYGAIQRFGLKNFILEETKNGDCKNKDPIHLEKDEVIFQGSSIRCDGVLVGYVMKG